MLPLHEGVLFTFFFFNGPATTEIYTLSLHDALPIYLYRFETCRWSDPGLDLGGFAADRKSTRLNSSHTVTSYAVFCLKKKSNPVRRPLGQRQPGGHRRGLRPGAAAELAGQRAADSFR